MPPVIFLIGKVWIYGGCNTGSTGVNGESWGSCNVIGQRIGSMYCRLLPCVGTFLGKVLTVARRYSGRCGWLRVGEHIRYRGKTI